MYDGAETHCRAIDVKKARILSIATWIEIMIARDYCAIVFGMVFEFSAIWGHMDPIVFNILGNPLVEVPRKQIRWHGCEMANGIMHGDANLIKKRSLMLDFLEAWLGPGKATGAYQPVTTWINDHHPRRNFPLLVEIKDHTPRAKPSRCVRMFNKNELRSLSPITTPIGTTSLGPPIECRYAAEDAWPC